MEHLRTFEGCQLKRCKFLHPPLSTCVGHLRNIQSTSGTSTNGNVNGNDEVLLTEPINLRDIKPSLYKYIHFISCDGRCVYDWKNSLQWVHYVKEELEFLKSYDMKVVNSGASAGIGIENGATIAGAGGGAGLKKIGEVEEEEEGVSATVATTAMS